MKKILIILLISLNIYATENEKVDITNNIVTIEREDYRKEY